MPETGEFFLNDLFAWAWNRGVLIKENGHEDLGMHKIKAHTYDLIVKLKLFDFELFFIFRVKQIFNLVILVFFFIYIN